MNETVEHAALNPLRLWCVLLVLLWAGLCANAQAQVDPNDLTVADLASHLIILTRDLQELEERVYSLERGVETRAVRGSADSDLVPLHPGPGGRTGHGRGSNQDRRGGTRPRGVVC